MESRLSRRALFGLGLTAPAVAGVVAAVATIVGGGTPLPRVEQVEARSLLPTGVHRFGDLIEARIEVLVPIAQVDPRSVHTRADFSPYQPLENALVERRRAGGTEFVRYRYRLECLEARCVPAPGTQGFDFAATRVEYRTRAGQARNLSVPWSGLVVVPRPRVDLFTPWEDGLQPLPGLGYRLSPRLAGAAAVALAALALLAAVALLRPLVRTPARAPAGGATWSLQRALAVVRAAAARGDVDERRRALDLLARLLRQGRGGTSPDAAELAWSRPAP
jgi:hypothetical protein